MYIWVNNHWRNRENPSPNDLVSGDGDVRPVFRAAAAAFRARMPWEASARFGDAMQEINGIR